MNFPPPFEIIRLAGAYSVKDALGRPLAYIYAREEESAAAAAHVLTFEEAKAVAEAIARLPELVGEPFVKGPPARVPRPDLAQKVRTPNPADR